MFRDKKTMLASAALFLFLLMWGTGFYIGMWPPVETEGKGSDRSVSRLKSENQYLKQRIKSMAPDVFYIVIDSGNNRLYLKKGTRVIREAVVSCGSGAVLRDPDKKTTWVFDTPRGVFTVQTKHVAPVWTKPDWAFIEEGEKIPGTVQGRMETGMLGDYALGFGSGYFIHGTLYTRLLGRNVTHGCVRVGDEDLKALFAATDIGTRIYIF